MGGFRYKPGMRLGPYNILYISREYKKGSRWYGKFECSECGETFITAVNYIAEGQTRSCGCVGGVKDWTGKRVGLLTVLYPTEKRESGHVVWHCKCDCGGEKDVSTKRLKDKGAQSCGCLFKSDLVGQRFGRLTVLYPIEGERSQDNYQIWYCECDCGGNKRVSTDSLVQGKTKSCGCLYSYGETIINRILTANNIAFTPQKTFTGCINPETNYPLRFDFYLDDFNVCIEYNGKQHYQPSGKTGWCTEEKVKELQARDKIKVDFCSMEDIPLIIIPYWERDIFSFLQKELYAYNVSLETDINDISIDIAERREGE